MGISNIFHKAVDSAGMLGTATLIVSVFTNLNPILEFGILIITFTLAVIKLIEKWREYKIAKRKKADAKK